MDYLKYINHYPEQIKQQVQTLLEEERLGAYLQAKYKTGHEIQNHKALYRFTQDLKKQYLKQSPPLSKVEYSDKVSALNALGTHTRISRVQGGRIKAKQEIHIDRCFKSMPLAFLRMIVVHELAHFREHEHNKAFYQLCQYMEPDYHQYELDMRLFLIWQAQSA